MKYLPILATIPRSGTWFLRYSISFLHHLERGGRVDDRLTGQVIGDAGGPPFDFRRFVGGPLFQTQGTLPFEHLFIGHTVCPGFSRIAGETEWWGRTAFHAPGYDYLHEGWNFEYTPVDLSPSRYLAVPVQALEHAPWSNPGQRMALIYRNPIDQIESYFDYCQHHEQPTFNLMKERPLAELDVRDYLFGGALLSYARQFISYQRLAQRLPAQVRLVAYEHLMEKPEEMLAELLDFLAGRPGNWRMLEAAIALARPQHLQAIELELGRSLDGSPRNGRSHIRPAGPRPPGRHRVAEADRLTAIDWLASAGIDVSLLAWGATKPRPHVEPATVAA
jgi:hypothetical protein